MKRILPALLVFFILLTLPVHAASGRLTAKADVSGSKATVTVRLDNPGIVATRIFVRYDSGVLKLTGAENGEVFPKSNAVFGKDLSDDPYTLLWDESLRRDNNTTSGTLCTLTFDVIGGSESGKTNVKIAVDKNSTFDVDLNEVTVADGACEVNVPVTSTKPNATTTTAAAKPTTQKPSAETTKAPIRSSDATTTKPVQTTKPTITIPKPTVTLPKPTITIPTATGAPEQTTKASAASTTAASAPGAPSTASQGTIDEIVQPVGTITTAANAADPAAETIPDLLTTGIAAESASETQVEPLIDPEPPTANHRNLLWLLLLIPAAAAIVLVIRKKKA